jgi:hypothetical protein
VTSTSPQDILWGNRKEPYYAAHPTLVRTRPLTKAEALRVLRDGWRYFAPVPRLSLGNRKGHCATSFDALVVDVDRDERSDLDDLLAETKANLHGDLWPPTVTVYSGNRGLHLYWKLDGDLRIEEIETLNRALSAMVGGDACHDRTRLFRHPGTVNPKSGRKAEILDLSAVIHPRDRVTAALDGQLETAENGISPTTSNPGESQQGDDQDWRTAAESLTGWKEPGEVRLDRLPRWQQHYLQTRPRKGWTYGGMSRSEVEQAIISQLIGKGFGASDAQIKPIADQHFAKHREERWRRGDDYLQRSIASARRHLYERGWITSPLGGWPRRRDPSFRTLSSDDRKSGLDLVRGQPLAEWVHEVRAELACSRSTAYRLSRRLCDEGLVQIESGVIRRLIDSSSKPRP